MYYNVIFTYNVMIITIMYCNNDNITITTMIMIITVVCKNFKAPKVPETSTWFWICGLRSPLSLTGTDYAFKAALQFRTHLGLSHRTARDFTVRSRSWPHEFLDTASSNALRRRAWWVYNSAELWWYAPPTSQTFKSAILLNISWHPSYSTRQDLCILRTFQPLHLNTEFPSQWMTGMVVTSGLLSSTNTWCFLAVRTGTNCEGGV